jgi:calcineurin-like phosphoesterase family protein
MARMEPLYYDAGFRWVGLEDYLAMTDHPFETLKLHHLPYTGDHHDSEERYREYRPKDNGLWLLHGHVHTTWKFKDRMINVGVDQWDFTPVSLDQIKAVIRSKNA